VIGVCVLTYDIKCLCLDILLCHTCDKVRHNDITYVTLCDMLPLPHNRSEEAKGMCANCVRLSCGVHNRVGRSPPPEAVRDASIRLPYHSGTVVLRTVRLQSTECTALGLSCSPDAAHHRAKLLCSHSSLSLSLSLKVVGTGASASFRI
jgi:hypothetical protein